MASTGKLFGDTSGSSVLMDHSSALAGCPAMAAGATASMQAHTSAESILLTWRWSEARHQLVRELQFSRDEIAAAVINHRQGVVFRAFLQLRFSGFRQLKEEAARVPGQDREGG